MTDLPEVVREPNGRISRAKVKGPGGRGQPCRMKPEVAAKIMEGLRAGIRLDVIGPYAGIGRETFFGWLREGRRTDGRPKYREFATQVDEALAHWEALKTLQISKAGDKEWQANAWLLERRLPEQYGRRTRVDGSVDVNIHAAPQWIELRDGLLGVLAAYPDALAAVIGYLGGGHVIDGEAVELAEIEAA